MADVMVLGLGGMGSAAAYHLSKRGVKVVGIEQFQAAHTRGSSHGESRIIRQAYYEDPAYVPLLRRAYALWEELQATTSEPLWRLTGGLTVGYETAPIVVGTLSSAAQHDVEVQRWSAQDVEKRIPSFSIRSGEVALFEPTAGALFPESCVRAHLRGAEHYGADLRFGENVTSWRADADHASVTLESGETMEAERLVICAGAWLNQVAADYWPIHIERNVQHWFAARDSEAALTLPVFLVQRFEGPRMFYGFPDFGTGVKIAFHHSAEYIENPAALKQQVEKGEIDAARNALAGLLRAGTGRHLRSVACMYSMTPDEHFIIGTHPEHPAAIVAGGFSGHGFKFCSVVGEIICDAVIQGSTHVPVPLFATDRFRGSAPAR